MTAQFCSELHPMYAVRDIVPPLVVHASCPLLLADGRSALLVAVASSLHVRLPLWSADGTCSFVDAGHEMHIGAVVVALVSCAHQCFIAVTRDHELLVARYQANLPAAPGSWLTNDVLHHCNAWIVLHRGALLAPPVARPLPNDQTLFAVGACGTVVYCSVLRRCLHQVRIELPDGAPKAFSKAKWAFDVTGSIGPWSHGAAPFRRDVIDQCDDELLTSATVAELAERKRSCLLPPAAPPVGSPPVKVLVHCEAMDMNIASVACLHARRWANKDHLVVAYATRKRLGIFDFSNPTFCGSATSIGMIGNPYLVFPRGPDLMLALTRERGFHTLVGIRKFAATYACHTGRVRIARGPLQPVAALVLNYPRSGPAEAAWGGEPEEEGEEREEDDFEDEVQFAVYSDSEGEEAEEEDELWVLLSNGTLAALPLRALLPRPGAREEKELAPREAPGLADWDCEKDGWTSVFLDGVPRGFRATSLVPFGPLAYGATRRYALLADGAADVYLVDLVARRAVGSLTSLGAMTAACAGPGGDVIAAHAKGALRRLAPVHSAPVTARAEIAPRGGEAVRRLFPLPLSAGGAGLLCLASSATRTCALRVTAGGVAELCGDEARALGVVLDEPTLAVAATPHGFAQCTTVSLAVAGARAALPPLDGPAAHAAFACAAITAPSRGALMLAVAAGRRAALLRCPREGAVMARVVLSAAALPADASHVALSATSAARWVVAAGLWSRAVAVWVVEEGRDGAQAAVVARSVLASAAVPLSSVRLRSGAILFALADRSVVALRGQTLQSLVDTTGRPVAADECSLVATAAETGERQPRFGAVLLREFTAELLAVEARDEDTVAVTEQLRVGITRETARGTVSDVVEDIWAKPAFAPSFSTYSSTSSSFSAGGLRCGFVAFLSSSATYVLVMCDGRRIFVSALPEMYPPHVSVPLPVSASSPSARNAFERRRAALLRLPVAYMETHSLHLPCVTRGDHSLTAAVYLHDGHTVLALVDRGAEPSSIVAVRVDTFCVDDTVVLRAGETPMCVEPLGPGAAVVGTILQPQGPRAESTGGRILLLRSRPLRIVATATLADEGAADVSVQGHGNAHLIAVATVRAVLVFRHVADDRLALLCRAECRAPCMTVALRYPFVACGLHLLGAQYMELVPESGGSGGNNEESALSRSAASWVTEDDDDDDSSADDESLESAATRGSGSVLGGESACGSNSDGGRSAMGRRWRGAAFSLRACAVEPTALAAVHAHVPFADGFARADAAGNVAAMAFSRASPPPPGGVSPDARVFGVEGACAGSLALCMRLPARALRIRGGPSPALPHKCRACPALWWAGRATSLRPVGPALLVPCADGALRVAAEIPRAFAGPLRRAEQRVAEGHGEGLAARRAAGGGAAWTYHAVGAEAAWAMRDTTRVLAKKGFVSVDLVEECFTAARIAEGWVQGTTAKDKEMAAERCRRMNESLSLVWEEYAGELDVIKLGEILHMW